MPTASKIHRRFLVLLVLSLALVGCGDEEQLPSAQEDKARAERIVLTEADLPGFALEEDDGDDESDPIRGRVRCGEDDPLLTEASGADERGAESSFTNIEDDSLNVLSEVTLGEDEKQAKAAFTQVTTPTFAACFEDAFRTSFGDVSSEVDLDVSVDEFETSAVGDEIVGYRVMVSASGPGGSRTGYLDFVFVRVDRALATIGGFRVAEPFDAVERDRLTKIVVDRMADA